ncbi:MAG: Gldg family protein [Planctomycetes bacterium]|nr:Gldg family protein [Planctomycetota bacterium]
MSQVSAINTGAARTGASAIHVGGIMAVWRRQLHSLLGNPLGYVFILAFVLASAATVFIFQGKEFFARNISDLGPLYQTMPWFLAVLLPALAMGSWASEREQGTEELLLTLPLSILDAVLGKFFAVATYFTIALALCALSTVSALAWLGNPDVGLMFANFIGWWLAGLAFVSLGVLASVIVGIPAIAFVVGIVFCGLIMWGAYNSEWFDAFNRGVVPIGNVVIALAVIAGAIGAAVLMLASRRWRPNSAGMVWAQVLSLAFGLLLAVNISRLTALYGIDKDLSVEGLSSLSPASREMLKSIAEPVTITAFISKELPAEMQLKKKEVEDKLKAVQRASTKVELRIRRPSDAYDEDGAAASREFSLKARKVMSDEVTGREMKEVYLGAAITCAGNTQVIEYFDPGLSVEYELVRAVRSVAGTKKRVLGIAKTDLDILGGFDYQTYGTTPEWEIVKEWRKQYDVRSVLLDSPVADDVEVLVVPQPSTLTQPQIERLHDYVWNGRAALLLEDPLPAFESKQELIPGKPKKSANPYGQPDENAPKKGDIKPLWKALGLDFDESRILWSDYNPSHMYRGLTPPPFIWVNAEHTRSASGAASGITSLLMPFSGVIGEAKDKSPLLTITPLVWATAGYPWGTVMLDDLMQTDPMGRSGLKDMSQFRRREQGKAENPPVLAVEVGGTMPSAYPEVDPTMKPAAPKEGDAAKKDGDAAPPAPTVSEKRTGVPSAKPVHVILIADTDFANDQFYQFYRNTGGQLSDDQYRALLDLRNVQFVANAVDQLFNDKAYLELRTRRPAPRPLERLENVYRVTQDKVRTLTDQAETAAENEIERAQSDFRREISNISAKEDLDEAAKANATAQAQKQGQRRVELEINAINDRKEEARRKAKAEQRNEVEKAQDHVKWLATGIPAVFLAILVLVVFFKRLASERAHVPAARKRAA